LSSPTRIALICATWHASIVNQGRQAFVAELQQHGWPATQVDCYEVPGAFEIPLLAQRLARGGQHAAVATLALVVDGGIYRHDFVAPAVVDALMRVQLDTGVPVLSGVLTPQAFHEHAEHQRFFMQHFVTKGTELAQACVRTLAVHATVAAG
jgi:6,7-dimethyl-8-ribityllumazine synthase